MRVRRGTEPALLRSLDGAPRGCAPARASPQPKAEGLGGVIRKAQETHERLKTGYRPNAGPDPALANLDALLDRLSGMGVALSGRMAPAGAAFADLLQARAEQRRGEHDRAARHARAAIGRDNKDLVAQRLALACEEGRDGLASSVDAWLSGRVCERPFTTAETLSGGLVRCCCSGWMPAPLGRLGDDGWDPVWNGPQARATRRSVEDGAFAYCSRIFCPHIGGRTLPAARADAPAPRGHRAGGFVATPPERLLLSHDRSCNLSCPSCRTEVIMAHGARSAQLDAFLEDTVLPLALRARSVKLTGSGDPFASRHFRRLLERMRDGGFEGVRLELQTNGVQLTPEMWERLDLDHRVDELWISLDAATARTYALTRRGGDWTRLQDNLAFVAEKRRQGRLGRLQVDYVVQALNYLELPAFVEIGRVHDVDALSVQRIRDWGTFGAGGFAAADVADPAHPEHEALLDLLADPVLDEPRLHWGNLREVRRTACARAAHRPPRRRPSRGGLLIVHEGRCGSTVLSDLLSASRALHVDGEIFTPTRFAQGRDDAADRLWTRLHAALPRRPVFEIKTYEIERLGLDWPRFLDLVASAGIDRMALLIRRNLLRRLISGDIAARNARFHARLDGFAPARLEPLTLETGNLARRIDWFLGHRRAAIDALAPQDPLRLAFEDDIRDDPSLGAARVFDHLDIARVPAPPSLVRAPRHRLDDLLLNADAVREALAGGPHAWMTA